MADDVPETEEIPEDRELGLEGFASEWDLQLFREAQVSLISILYIVFTFIQTK